MSCVFGVNDIRGLYPEELDETMAYRVGLALPGVLAGKSVAVGRDVRLSSPALAKALTQGLIDGGCDVLDIGLCGTEMIYFATAHYGLDGGVMVTASHNPREYNGLKIVGREARPLAGTSAWEALKEQVLSGKKLPQRGGGSVRRFEVLPDYMAKLLSFVEIDCLHALRVVADVGNGAAGLVLDALQEHLPSIELIRLHAVPDGSFPHGAPNPLLPEQREAAAQAVRKYGADLGVAWDGDFDRCFFYDERGNFVDSCYMVGFLAQAFLKKHGSECIVHDPRCVWNTIELTNAYGGTAVICQGGHALIKAKMRETGAVYGGEMSAHHYFRDFYYCDSGMVPWLLVLELLSREGRSLSSLLMERQKLCPVSGEINRRVEDAQSVLERLEKQYGKGNKVSHLDGLTVDSSKWRFNLRPSNTEPGLLRLNVETRGDSAFCKHLTEQLLLDIDS